MEHGHYTCHIDPGFEGVTWGLELVLAPLPGIGWAMQMTWINNIDWVRSW